MPVASGSFSSWSMTWQPHTPHDSASHTKSCCPGVFVRGRAQGQASTIPLILRVAVQLRSCLRWCVVSRSGSPWRMWWTCSSSGTQSPSPRCSPETSGSWVAYTTDRCMCKSAHPACPWPPLLAVSTLVFQFSHFLLWYRRKGNRSPTRPQGFVDFGPQKNQPHLVRMSHRCTSGHINIANKFSIRLSTAVSRDLAIPML